MRNFLFVFSSWLLASWGWAQSPWPQAQGGGFVQLSGAIIPNYDGVFAPSLPDGKYPTPRLVTDAGLHFYGEYGLGDKTSLLLHVPWKILATGDPNEGVGNPPNEEATLSGLGNVSVGIKQALLVGAWRVSGFLQIDTPAGTADEASGLRTGYDTWLIYPGLTAGSSRGRHYFFGYAGIQFATQNISHSLQGGAEWGYRTGDRLILALAIVGRASLENIPEEELLQDWTGLYINNQAFLSPGLKALYDLPNGFGLSAGVYGAFAARNVSNNASINVGVYRKW